VSTGAVKAREGGKGKRVCKTIGRPGKQKRERNPCRQIAQRNKEKGGARGEAFRNFHRRAQKGSKRNPYDLVAKKKKKKGERGKQGTTCL